MDFFLWLALYMGITVVMGVVIKRIRRHITLRKFNAGDHYIEIGPPSHRQVKLTDDERADLELLKLDLKEIEGAIAANRRMLATSTQKFDIDWHTTRIEALKGNLQAKKDEIRDLELGRGRPENHSHSELIPVESGADIVAWICGTCDAQLDETDAAVKLWIELGVKRAARIAQKADADARWAAAWATPGARDEAIERSAIRRSEATTKPWDAKRKAQHEKRVAMLLRDQQRKQDFVRMAKDRRKEGWM